MTHETCTHEDTTVVGVDGSAHSRSAIKWAAAYAAASSSTLVLVHAGVNPQVSLSDAVNLRHGRASRALAHARSTLATARVVAQSVAGDDVHIETLLEAALPADALIEHARHARLLVLGKHDQGKVARALLGSVSSKVASRARCPIAIVPENNSSTGFEDGTTTVVVGIDQTSDDDSVLATAFDQADRLHARLHAVHALQKSTRSAEYPIPDEHTHALDPRAPAQRWLDGRVAAWEEKYPAVTVTASVIEGKPSDAVLGCARHAQLIVVGARSRGSVEPVFVGSTSRAVLHHTAIPTLIVPAARR